MNRIIEIEEFLKLSKEHPIIDVRSEGEHAQGHIPGAHSIPLFNNEERARVGTLYKQAGKDKAIQLGYEIANPKIGSILSGLEKSTGLTDAPSQTVLVHCWRGGMRSAKFAAMLNRAGFQTYTLLNGYKSFRNYALNLFKEELFAPLIILGGETGSGKTEVLQCLADRGETVIDLEKIAHHKGSAFGALGELPQPSTEQFENILAMQLLNIKNKGEAKRIWLEDESRNIGSNQIPPEFWSKMKQAPILRLQIDKPVRIKRLVNDYGKFSKEDLAGSIQKIHKRLGGQHAKRALEELEKGNLAAVADITLTYYDRAYHYQHELRKMKGVHLIKGSNEGADANAKRLIAFATEQL